MWVRLFSHPVLFFCYSDEECSKASQPTASTLTISKLRVFVCKIESEDTIVKETEETDDLEKETFRCQRVHSPKRFQLQFLIFKLFRDISKFWEIPSEIPV